MTTSEIRNEFLAADSAIRKCIAHGNEPHPDAVRHLAILRRNLRVEVARKNLTTRDEIVAHYEGMGR